MFFNKWWYWQCHQYYLNIMNHWQIIGVLYILLEIVYVYEQRFPKEIDFSHPSRSEGKSLSEKLDMYHWYRFIAIFGDDWIKSMYTVLLYSTRCCLTSRFLCMLQSRDENFRSPITMMFLPTLEKSDRNLGHSSFRKWFVVNLFCNDRRRLYTAAMRND